MSRLRFFVFAACAIALAVGVVACDDAELSGPEPGADLEGDDSALTAPPELELPAEDILIEIAEDTPDEQAKEFSSGLARLELEEELADLGIDPDAMTADDQERLRVARLERAGALGPDISMLVLEMGAITGAKQDYFLFDTYVAQSAPTTNYGFDTYARIGRHSAGWDNALFKDFICPSGSVTAAELWVNITTNALTGTLPVTVQGLAATWSEGSVTWNTKPGFAGTTNDTNVLTTNTGWIALNATNAVIDVCTNTLLNFGLSAFENPTTELGYFDVTVWETVPTGRKPFLAIYYAGLSANDTCSAPISIPTIPGFAHGDTTGDTNDYDRTSVAGCTLAAAAPDIVYQFSVTSGLTYQVDLRGMDSQDTIVYVRQNPCASGTQLACSDDTDTLSHSVATFTAPSSGTYYVFVDGYGSGAVGDFNLTITTVTTTTTTTTPTTTTTTTPTTTTTTTPTTTTTTTPTTTTTTTPTTTTTTTPTTTTTTTPTTTTTTTPTTTTTTTPTTTTTTTPTTTTTTAPTTTTTTAPTTTTTTSGSTTTTTVTTTTGGSTTTTTGGGDDDTTDDDTTDDDADDDTADDDATDDDATDDDTGGLGDDDVTDDDADSGGDDDDDDGGCCGC